MKPTLRCSLLLGLGLLVIGKGTLVAQTTAAGSPTTSLTVTIQVQNNAQVDSKTLAEAEKVATKIFSNVGVEICWVDVSVTSEYRPGNPVDQGSVNFSHIWLTIAPHLLAELNLPSGVMGFAPGMRPNRKLIYVLYDRVETIYQRQTMVRIGGSTYASASRAQLLGHVIAHELGHVLLNIEAHSKTGIMRGRWNLKDLQDVSCGRLLFTSQQAEVIRTDVFRRVTDSKTPQIARLESPKLDH